MSSLAKTIQIEILSSHSQSTELHVINSNLDGLKHINNNKLICFSVSHPRGNVSDSGGELDRFSARLNREGLCHDQFNNCPAAEQRY